MGRVRLTITGAVQGVGFRPFLYQLANGLGLTGWAQNTASGVVVEAEGPLDALERFTTLVQRDAPPQAVIAAVEVNRLPPVNDEAFLIRDSDTLGRKTAYPPVDVATCSLCVQELFSPDNRRHRYPFITCVHCGPRYSLLEKSPYDRANTTMSGFKMCRDCGFECENPRDRRFHSQTNACPSCGPQLAWTDGKGNTLARCEEALQAAVRLIREGGIAAVKGLGGFHLLVDARDEAAVRRLRQRKNRKEKPFAVLFQDLNAVEGIGTVNEVERGVLQSPEAPIVLVRRRGESGLAPSVAPGTSWLGAMLPYTPMHHLMMRELGFPVVATSGNRSDEPISVDNREAFVRLDGVADAFLIHDRPIRRRVDDSVVRVIAGQAMVIRRARGYTPRPIRIPEATDVCLAVGAHLKNAVAVASGPAIFLSQHIGDLDTLETRDAFEQACSDLTELLDSTPAVLACDVHPDYHSSRYAEANGRPVRVQHHYAHVLSGMAEHGLDGEVLGVAWDGTGYGTDGTFWGGEFLIATRQNYQRFAHLRPFPLPGGEAAIREPRRAALGLLYTLFGTEVSRRIDLAPVRSFDESERQALTQLLHSGTQCVSTTSVGRLFDVAAALLDLQQVCSFEGQAAMALENVLGETPKDGCYPLTLTSELPGTGVSLILDWEPMIESLIQDLAGGTALSRMAWRIHNALAESVVAVAEQAKLPRVVLSGGCFQNACLCEQTIHRLRQAGFQPYWARRIPPNDGGIALGQAFHATHQK